MDGLAIDQYPMRMPSWSFGMVCVWIIKRAPETSERLWSAGLTAAILGNDDSVQRDYAAAKEALIQKLTLGEISATGILDNGQRMQIMQLDWEDMTGDLDERSDCAAHDDPLVHRFHSASGVTFSKIRLPRERVLECWPPEELQSATVLDFQRPTPKRGRKPVVLNQVIEKMRAFDLGSLATWTEEAMQAEFGASRQTCRNARSALLSEMAGNDLRQ